MTKGFSVLDNPNHEGKTNSWLTPLPIIKSLGNFDLDPCAFYGHNTARTRWHGELYDICGLTEPWFGRVWLNPPYGRHIGKWLNKLEAHGNGIALVFTRTDTKWFHELNPTAIFFIRGRIKFLREDFNADTNAGHGSMFLAYGKQNVKAITDSKIRGKLMS